MSYQAKYCLLVFSVLSAIALFNSCKVASPTESKKTEIPPPLTVYRPPGAPANLKAKATSLSTIEVDWTDTSHIATWFVIERENIADSSWQIVDSTLGSVTAYIDAGLVCDNTYDYRVYGDNNIGRSISSNIAHATTPFDSVDAQKSGFHNDLYGVAFFDNSTGLVVGRAGLILKTTNAGASWDSVQSRTTQNLISVSVNGTTGMAVGMAGTVLRTNDIGATWVLQESGTNNSLNSVAYLGSNSWVTVGNGGTIFRTSDGGSNWLDVSSFGGVSSVTLQSVSFANSNIGLIAGNDGTILLTTDGGISWAKPNSATTSTLYSVSMVSPTTATAVGAYGTIIHTTNGGLTWTTTPSGVSNNWLYGVSFVDSSKGFAVGTFGLFLHTNDGGTTWLQQSLNVPMQNLLGIYSRPGNDVTIVGTSNTILRIFSCL